MDGHGEQSSKHEDEKGPVLLINEKGARFWYARNWLSNPGSLYRELSQEIEWEQHLGEMNDKTYKVPRLMYHMGDQINHGYPGVELGYHSWHPLMIQIRDVLRESFNCHLDSCLLNYYPDGQNYISMHSDRENKGVRTITIGLTLGATRDFVLKRKSDGHRIVFENRPGDLYVMDGTVQQYWKHGIPKRMKVKEGRISATFRQLLPDEYYIQKNKTK